MNSRVFISFAEKYNYNRNSQFSQLNVSRKRVPNKKCSFFSSNFLRLVPVLLSHVDHHAPEQGENGEALCRDSGSHHLL